MPVVAPNTPSRTIGVEEHFVTQGLVQGARTAVDTELLDVGEGRIAAMDRAGMGMQVLSLTAPGVEQLDPAAAVGAAREANEQLAAAVRAHADRFAGFAALPMSAPEEAAAELERAVADGFVGANVNGHARGRYLDDPVFEPVLATAERLAVPLYLHPTPPPAAVIEASYTGAFSAGVTARFASSGWGWHHETGTHALRLVLAGVFDRLPGLQVMLGHHGETIPMLMPRIERNFPRELTGLDRPLRDYLRENVHYTFGGWSWTSLFDAVRRLVGCDRILFSTDYPYGSMEESHTFLEQLEIGADERELIAHGNAERLLGLPRR